MPFAQRAVGVYNDYFLPPLGYQKTNTETLAPGHFRLVQSSSWTPNEAQVTTSGPYNTHVTRANTDVADRHVVRKKQLVRRKLAGGLTPINLIPAGSYPRKTQSFLHRSDAGGDWSNDSNRTNLFTARRERHSVPQSRQLANQVKRSLSQNLDDSRAKQAIQAWNDLVQEINRRKNLLHLDSQHHLTIWSDKTPKDSSTSTELVKDNITDIKDSHINHAMKWAGDVLSEGLGVTRYRPLSPNLLAGLDKKKISSRALTQLWVDKLPDTNRTYQMTRTLYTPSEHFSSLDI